MMWWYDNGPGWGGWVVMTVMMLAFWGALVFGGVALWRALSREQRGRPTDTRSEAERLLDERFARGDIEEADYLHRRELLRTGR